MEYKVNLIEHDHLRLCEETLASIAPQSIFVIDEVHKALNETKRTSVALSLSHLAEEFIALTGTPIIDSNTYKLIWWLEQIVPFEVNERNFWVAANGMVAKKVNTGVLIEREEITATMTIDEREQYHKLVPPGLGGKNSTFSQRELRTATDLCYDACTREMIQVTAKTVKEGKGVMVVAHNAQHQSQLLKGLVKKGIKARDIFLLSAGNSIFLTDETVEEGKEHDYKVVITTIRKSEGYTLTRLKALVTCVYPSNNATREQIEGRINRIGQKAKEVQFFTVHVGILSYIMKRHKDARNLSAILETLADEIQFLKGTEF
jgi:superfamily II DNA or RNA helicase